ncbi:MAG: dual specificity protein phosphatase family protein [Promethearchaeota archaeon]
MQYKSDYSHTYDANVHNQKMNRVFFCVPIACSFEKDIGMHVRCRFIQSRMELQSLCSSNGRKGIHKYYGIKSLHFFTKDGVAFILPDFFYKTYHTTRQLRGLNTLMLESRHCPGGPSTTWRNLIGQSSSLLLRHDKSMFIGSSVFGASDNQIVVSDTEKQKLRTEIRLVIFKRLSFFETIRFYWVSARVISNALKILSSGGTLLVSWLRLVVFIPEWVPLYLRWLYKRIVVDNARFANFGLSPLLKLAKKRLNAPLARKFISEKIRRTIIIGLQKVKEVYNMINTGTLVIQRGGGGGAGIGEIITAQQPSNNNNNNNNNNYAIQSRGQHFIDGFNYCTLANWSIGVIDEVVPYLYVGGNCATKRKTLEEGKIQVIVNCTTRNDFGYTYNDRIAVLFLDLEDSTTENISRHFDAAYTTINGAIENSQAVLVHCAFGVSRSASIVIMYLMRRNMWSFDEAFSFLKTKRSKVKPNSGFVLQLREFEKQLYWRRRMIQHNSNQHSDDVIHSPVHGRVRVIANDSTYFQGGSRTEVYIRGPFDPKQDDHRVFAPVNGIVRFKAFDGTLGKQGQFLSQKGKTGYMRFSFGKRVIVHVYVGAGYVTDEIRVDVLQEGKVKVGEVIGEIVVDPLNSYAIIFLPVKKERILVARGDLITHLTPIL